MKKKKICIGYYTIADYEKEEKWLNEMSRKGWNLIQTCGVIFTFEQGTPGEYIYKIDLPNEKMTDDEVDSYYKFMADCGIETVCTFKSWRYLRKKKSDGTFDMADNTLTQLAMVNKAYSLASKMINTLLVIFAILIASAAIVSAFTGGRLAEFMICVSAGISTSSIIALTIFFVPISRRLRLRMNKLIEEIQIKN